MRTKPQAWTRLAGVGLSAALHLAILLALLLTALAAPRLAAVIPVEVELAPTSRFDLPAERSQPAAAPAAKSVSRRAVPGPPASPSATDVAPDVPAADGGDELSPGQLAGASPADDAPAGGCDMAGRVQAALRRDPLVRAALAGAEGGAIMVWNGDWVRRRGEDGKGLAAAREAVMWVVAFAPPACRAEAVHGLILFSIGDGDATPRLAVGAGAWRWSDLLGPTGPASGVRDF